MYLLAYISVVFIHAYACIHTSVSGGGWVCVSVREKERDRVKTLDAV